jgi:hypothetical protein
VYGANPRCRNAVGETPLNLASRLAQVDACRYIGLASTGYTTEARIAAVDFPYFHGKINRKVAEQIVTKNGAGEGLFLVRSSSSVPRDFILTMSSGGQPFHFQVRVELLLILI